MPHVHWVLCAFVVFGLRKLQFEQDPRPQDTTCCGIRPNPRRRTNRPLVVSDRPQSARSMASMTVLKAEIWAGERQRSALQASKGALLRLKASGTCSHPWLQARHQSFRRAGRVASWSFASSRRRRLARPDAQPMRRLLFRVGCGRDVTLWHGEPFRRHSRA